jgi:hypothetical protein
MVLSTEPLTRFLFLNCIKHTIPSECPFSKTIHLSLDVSHILIVWSSVPTPINHFLIQLRVYTNHYEHLMLKYIYLF